MDLKQSTEPVTRPAIHYVFIEKTGPFQEIAQGAWGEMHKNLGLIKEVNQVTGFVALYKFQPQMTYRAGVSLTAAPTGPLPAGWMYELVPGGSFMRWTLTGSWSNLPQASGVVWDDVKKQKIAVRNGFNIENYVNSPDNTPENELKTEIFVAII